MSNYGRVVTSGDSDYGIATSNSQRAAVYGLMSESGWAHTLHGWFGKTAGGDANASVRMAVWRTSSMNPAERLCYTSPFTVSSVGASGSTTTKYTSSVANVASAYSPGSNAIKLHSGERYSLGFATTEQVGHAMVQAASISADNESFYYRSGLSTPSTPNGYTSSSNEGHLSMHLEYQKNRQPTAGTVAPSGTISSSTPIFEGTFTDADSVYGDQITLYRIQVYRDSDSQLMWDSGSKVPTSTQQSNDEFLITYQGSSLSAGVLYRWRCMVADDFGTWSSWSSYTTFTINNGGWTLPQTPVGKQTTITPGPFLTDWVHSSGLSTAEAQVRILQSGTTIQTSAAIAKVVSNGGTINVSWAETGFTDLSWGGTSYSWQVRAKDSGGVWSGWTAQVFTTNAAPGIPTNLSPANSAASSSRPKLTCRVTDADDSTLTVKARIKNNAGSVLQTRTMALKGGTTDTYEYQTVSGDLASHATYRWDAYAFDGSLYSGEQTVEASSSKSAEAVFIYADGPTVTITAPTTEFTSASPTVTWTTTGQVQRRVWLYLEGTNTVVYQSTLDTTASTSFSIPSGYVRNGITYDLVVEVVNSAPLTGYSSILTVEAVFDAPDAVTSFQASPEFQEHDQSPSSIRLTWGESEESNFVEYIITRRLAGESEEHSLIITRITSPSSTTYIDYFPESGVEYTYEIAQATIEGLDILVSDVSQAQASITLEHVVLCSVNDPASHRMGLRLDSNRGFEHVDDLVLEVPWGLSAPIPFYGTTQYEQFKGSFTLANDNSVSAKDQIAGLRAMWRSRSTFCYRDERGRKLFAQIAKFSETDRRVQFYSVDINLIEVSHREGVS
jgi:hypothetical protein